MVGRMCIELFQRGRESVQYLMSSDRWENLCLYLPRSGRVLVEMSFAAVPNVLEERRTFAGK